MKTTKTLGSFSALSAGLPTSVATGSADSIVGAKIACYPWYRLSAAIRNLARVFILGAVDCSDFDGASLGRETYVVFTLTGPLVFRTGALTRLYPPDFGEQERRPEAR